MRKGLKRVLAFILTVALVMTLMPYMQGNQQEVKAAEVTVSTAQELIANAAASEDTYIYLSNDIQVSQPIEHSSGNLYLYLNGHTISGAAEQSMTSVLHVTGGNVTIFGESEMGKETIVAPAGAACVRVEKNANVIAMGGIYSAKNGSPAIAVYKDTGTYKDFNKHFLPAPSEMTYVLTDYNCAVVGNYIWSASDVEVVAGETISFNTRRSQIETYHIVDTEDAEAAASNYADNYSITPLTIGAEEDGFGNKVIYQTDLPQPAADQSRLPSGVDSLTFAGWSGSIGAIESMDDVRTEYQLCKQNQWSPVLYGTWEATVSTAAGFDKAIKSHCVSKITLASDLTLTDSYELESELEIDLNGHTITYAGSDTLFCMYANFKISDALGTGGIKCTGGAICVSARFDLTIDGGIYQTNGPVAVRMESNGGNRNVSLAAGTFRSTAADGHGLIVPSDFYYEPYVGLLSNTNTNTTLSDNQEYTGFARKLIISKDADRTYAIGVNHIAFDSVTYGDQNQILKKISIENSGNSDITITGITLTEEGSNALSSRCLSLDGVQAGQIQPGIEVPVGETDETAGIRVNADAPAGTYQGIVTIYYKSTCDPGATYSKTAEVSITVNKRKLTVSNPSITLEKVYDATRTAQVKAGDLTNLVGTDSVSVTASATYDTANAGTKKSVTVSYSMSGSDSGNYIVPDNQVYKNGKIAQATGEAQISVIDCRVGEKLQVQPVSKTNGIKHITYYYKEKGASDSLYTTMIPTEAGAYTIKAVFAATTNYAQVSATADFSITQIAAPSTPYTISGQFGSHGWYLSSVTIHPPVGYTISTSKNGDFTTSLVVDASASPVIYLKSQTGAVTAPISVSPIQIDMSAPSVNGQGEGITVGTTVWNSMANLLDFDRFYKDKQQVVIHASDPESQIVSYQYLVAATQMSLSELQQSTAWESGQSFTIEPQSVQQSILYAKITNGAGLISYVSSNGLVFDTQAPAITGMNDGETYYGDEWTFTVSDDYLDTVTINGTTQQMTDKASSFILTADDKHNYQIVATDKSGNRTTITVSVQEAWLRDGISSEGKKELTTGVAYKFGGGKWSVEGDATVYEGNSTFYATTSGEYNFTQE